MTETNLWPPRPEMWECSTYKGTTAVLPRCSSAICPSVVRWLLNSCLGIPDNGAEGRERQPGEADGRRRECDQRSAIGRAANFLSYISSFCLLSSPPVLLVDLHLITVIMRLPIVGLLSLAVAGLVAGSSLYQDVTHIVERQANASSLNATLLQLFEDIDEAKTCNDCEACYTRRFLTILCLHLPEHPDYPTRCCGTWC